MKSEDGTRARRDARKTADGTVTQGTEAAAGAKIRLFVEADLGADTAVGLTPAQAHYLKHVMRLAPGDDIALFNGRDGEWLARIEALGRGWCSAVLIRRLREQTVEPDLWLVFAPIKRARIDFLAEKATELGVSALWPVFTRHTAVSRVNPERLRANAVAAAEQSRRLTVPEVRAPVALTDLPGNWPADRRLVLCDETGASPPVAEALAAAGAGAGTAVVEADRGPAGSAVKWPTKKWAVLTGPEGGFARSELDALGQLPFVTRVGLGPRVLRADTAALAVLACWQALLGDWRKGPPQGAAPASD